MFAKNRVSRFLSLCKEGELDLRNALLVRRLLYRKLHYSNPVSSPCHHLSPCGPTERIRADMHSPAFCFPTLPVSKRPYIAAKSWTCSASRDGERHSLSRRAILFAIANFAVQAGLPSNAEQNKETKKESPTTGYLTQSGLKYFDFNVGEGPPPKWGDYVLIKYTSYTITPSGDALVQHDTSDKYFEGGYLIHHGNGEQVFGLEEAIHSMGVGGRRRAIVPRKIAYSNANLGPVPRSDRKRRQFSKALQEGDGSVVFDIELVKKWDDPDDRGYYTDLTPTDEELMEIMNSDDPEWNA